MPVKFKFIITALSGLHGRLTGDVGFPVINGMNQRQLCEIDVAEYT